jgi:hypothetical protein
MLVSWAERCCLDGGVADWLRATQHDAVQMGTINGALATAQPPVVAGHLNPGMMDADLAAADLHGDLCPNQLPRLLTALATRFPGPIREGTLPALDDEGDVHDISQIVARMVDATVCASWRTSRGYPIH